MINKLKEDGQGGLTGMIVTLEHNLKINLKQCVARTPDSPAFEIFAVGKGAIEIKVGAAWEKKTKAGEVFYSLTIDDVSFNETLNVTAFKGEGFGVYDIVWQRPRQQNKLAA
ncbi:MAG: DUF736 family protein [Methylomonas sp.]|nr:DUF736 family protein [Methylomonas sp.]